ncbi:DUF3558 family protein [Amycolatopsis anabasis]|uniref:DUF3558 family protein n=1 Tax=Amycolatopsis anabasis TaxID=1840409 RepID=UPI001FE625E3|nr:DUF3558 family protein [Amycolatopsis anabasis]
MAGCSSKQVGTALPAATPAASSAGNQDVFAEMNACEVLDDLLAGQGFDPGVNKTSRNECNTGKIDAWAVGLALDPVQGLAEFTKTDPNATSTDINGRRALQSAKAGGNCDIAIEVAEHARAVIGVTAGVHDDGCPIAKQYAEKLEPKLPKVQ